MECWTTHYKRRNFAVSLSFNVGSVSFLLMFNLFCPSKVKWQIDVDINFVKEEINLCLISLNVVIKLQRSLLIVITVNVLIWILQLSSLIVITASGIIRLSFQSFPKTVWLFFKAIHIKGLIGKCYHLNIGIRYCLAQSDHIKRCLLTCQFSINRSALLQLAPICLFSPDTVIDPNSSY